MKQVLDSAERQKRPVSRKFRPGGRPAGSHVDSNRRTILKALGGSLLLGALPRAYAQEVAEPYNSFALAKSASGSTPLDELSATIDGHLIRWVRAPDGPCLGGGWAPAGDVTAQHFDMSRGAAPALREAMLQAAKTGSKMLILPGLYLIERSISAELPGSLVIEFSPGARLIAAPGLSKTVLYPRGAKTSMVSCTTLDLTIINPQIDCSEGSSPSGKGGGFCSALSFNYLRNVRIEGGELYGGDAPENPNADSGITWVTCCDVTVDGVKIEGFNDCAIYPGGNNMLGTDGDGGTGKITRCEIRNCRSAVSAKREMTLLIFQGNTVEGCLAGVSSQDVRGAGGVPGARRLEISDNTFSRCMSNVIRPRGATVGFARNNLITNFGFHPVTGKSAKRNAVAINMDGSDGFRLDDNIIVLEDDFRDSQLALLFSQHTFGDMIFDHANCVGSGNTYMNIPRIMSFHSPGGPHKFVNEIIIGAGPQPFDEENVNPDTVVTYYSDDLSELHVWPSPKAEPTR